VGVMPQRTMNKDIDKQTIKTLATMIESHLIWYKHYFPWTDEIISNNSDIPSWLINLSSIKYIPDAVKSINEYIYSEPFEPFNEEKYSDQYVACLYLRYETRAISWASFLLEAGQYSDAYYGRHECEYFFQMLNEYEDSEYSERLEKKQSREIYSEFKDVIQYIKELYSFFMKHFRTYKHKYKA
jgi:hypothetical protein